jgi:TatD DNase family protein
LNSLLVDTHCHLNFDSFAEDRDAVLERARREGVTRMLNPGVDIITSREAVALAIASPEIFAAAGVHPNDALTWEDQTEESLRDLLRHPRVAAVGEIGLDYFWKKAPPDLQKQIFRRQLELAAEAGLPVVVHTRNAAPDDHQATREALEILAAWRKNLEALAPKLTLRPGVLHSFSDDLIFAQQAIEMGFFIGITGPVTFRKAEVLRNVVAGLPLETLLVETDSPFLTPHPHRGERNEPAYVRFVIEKIAQVRNLDFETVAAAAEHNATRLFLW